MVGYYTDIAACACKVWTLFGQACGQKECSQTTMMTTTTTTMTMTTTTDKSWLHRLATDILSWAKKLAQDYEHVIEENHKVNYFYLCTKFILSKDFLQYVKRTLLLAVLNIFSVWAILSSSSFIYSWQQYFGSLCIHA